MGHDYLVQSIVLLVFLRARPNESMGQMCKEFLEPNGGCEHLLGLSPIGHRVSRFYLPQKSQRLEAVLSLSLSLSDHAFRGHTA